MRLAATMVTRSAPWHGAGFFPFTFIPRYTKRSVATLMKQRILLLLVLQLAMLASAVAQQPKITPVPPTPQAPTAGESKVTEPPHALTADDVHAFLDGFVPMQLEREDIAGAVVLVVKDGAILF